MSDIKPAIKAYSELQQAYDWFTYRKLKNQTIPLSTPYAT